MKITLKLFATLSDYLPAQARENEIEVDVEDKATPHQVLDQYRIPRNMVHLVLLNGVYVNAAQRDQPVIRTGDALAVWPPVAGG